MRKRLLLALTTALFLLVACVTPEPPATFDPEQFRYSWWSTLLYGFDAMGWGESYYSAVRGLLPYHERPDEPMGLPSGENWTSVGKKFCSAAVTHDPAARRYTRQTDKGILTVVADPDRLLYNGSFSSGAGCP